MEIPLRLDVAGFFGGSRKGLDKLILKAHFCAVTNWREVSWGGGLTSPPPCRLRLKNGSWQGIKNTENAEKRYNFFSPSSPSHTLPYLPSFWWLVGGWLAVFVFLVGLITKFCRKVWLVICAQGCAHYYGCGKLK